MAAVRHFGHERSRFKDVEWMCNIFKNIEYIREMLQQMVIENVIDPKL